MKKFRVWVLIEQEEPNLKKGWLEPQCAWYHLDQNGEEIQWGFDGPEEPLLIGRDCVCEFSAPSPFSDLFEGDKVEVKGEEYYSNDSIMLDDEWTFTGIIKNDMSGWYVEDDKHGWIFLNAILENGFEVKKIGNIHESEAGK